MIDSKRFSKQTKKQTKAGFFKAINRMRWRLVRRIFVASLSLSAVVWFGTFYYEMKRMDHVFAERFSVEVAQLPVATSMTKGGGAIDRLLDEVIHSTSSGISNDRFISGEVYGPDGTSFGQVTHPGYEHVVETLGDDHELPSRGDIWFKKVSLDDESFMKAVVPIVYDGAVVGHFEGIYHISSTTVWQVQDSILRTIIAVMAAVLGTGLIIYPIMSSQQKEIVNNAQGLLKSNLDTIKLLGNAIAKRDSDTHIHNFRVTLYSVHLAQQMKLPEEDIRRLIKGAFLHDVGKIAIADAILLKPGRLDKEEFEVMKTHVAHGRDIIGNYEWLLDAVEVVMCHHEKWDGSGYPEGIAGDDIPVNARIFAVADVFDALTSRRPYKYPMPFDKAVAILEDGRGAHFDPVVLDAFAVVGKETFDRFGGREDSGVEDELDAVIKRYFSFSA